MTLTLLLIRHARAGIGDVDHAKPLDGRGRAQAPRMGAWVAAKGLVPARVLCSDAHRTRETLDLMLPLWSPPPRLTHLRPLYHASPEAILAVLAAEADGPSVGVVGHNPGLGDLAARLARLAPDHPRWGDFPPCSAAALRFEAEGWGDLRDGMGEVAAFAVPEDRA